LLSPADNRLFIFFTLNGILMGKLFCFGCLWMATINSTESKLILLKLRTIFLNDFILTSQLRFFEFYYILLFNLQYNCFRPKLIHFFGRINSLFWN
jgi:hypothetical protein